VTNTQPQWRYVPFVSTLLMCSGLFMLLHGAPGEPARPFIRGSACEGVTAPSTPHAMSRMPTGEDSPDTRGDGGKPFIPPSTMGPADTDRLNQTPAADANRWTSIGFSVLRLRGPPAGDDDDDKSHRWGTGPVDSSFDAFDDDDDSDDDTDTDDGDGLATQIAPSAGVSCTLHTSSLVSRLEIHHPSSHASDVQSLRAPPQ
jgi:hypothetical protein